MAERRQLIVKKKKKKNETGDRWRPAQRVRVQIVGFRKSVLNPDRLSTIQRKDHVECCPESVVHRLAKPVADNNKDRRLKYGGRAFQTVKPACWKVEDVIKSVVIGVSEEKRRADVVYVCSWIR